MVNKITYRIVKLFGFFPIYSWKISGNKKCWRILGIEVFKKKVCNEYKSRYYLLGIPVMKVTKNKI